MLSHRDFWFREDRMSPLARALASLGLPMRSGVAAARARSLRSGVGGRLLRKRRLSEKRASPTRFSTATLTESASCPGRA